MQIECFNIIDDLSRQFRYLCRNTKHKTMRQLFLPCILAFGLFNLSCNSQVKNNDNKSTSKTGNSETLVIDGQTYKPYNGEKSDVKNGSSSTRVPIKYFDIKDTNNGMSTGTVPLPENFVQHTSGKYLFTGPNNIRLHGSSGKYFAFSNNPQEEYNYQQMGLEIQFPKSMEQILEDSFIAYGNTINRKMVKYYPLPEVANFYRQFDGLLYKGYYTPKMFETIGIDWVDPDGTCFQTILTRNQETGPNAHFWGFDYQVIEAPKAQFEEAKQIFINSIVNQEVNYNWVQTMNNQLKTSLAANNRQWDEWRAANKYANDQFQAGQAKRRKDQDAVNEQIYDHLTDRTTTVDPNSGQERKPESGSTYYWYNENGEYISTDKSYYNPNTDPAMNQNHTWTLNSKKY